MKTRSCIDVFAAMAFAFCSTSAHAEGWQGVELGSTAEDVLNRHKDAKFNSNDGIRAQLNDDTPDSVVGKKVIDGRTFNWHADIDSNGIVFKIMVFPENDDGMTTEEIANSITRFGKPRVLQPESREQACSEVEGGPTVGDNLAFMRQQPAYFFEKQGYKAQVSKGKYVCCQEEAEKCMRWEVEFGQKPIMIVYILSGIQPGAF